MIGGLIKILWHTKNLRLVHGLWREIFRDKVYRIPDWGRIRWVVDIGANCGMFALWVRHNAPDAHVLCYEPQPEMEKAVKSTGAMFFNCAITQKGMPYVLFRDYVGDPGCGVYHWGKKFYPECHDIAHAIFCPVDLLKIDVEGEELGILWDMVDRDLFRFVSRILVETHENFDNVKRILDEQFNYVEVRGKIIYAEKG